MLRRFLDVSTAHVSEATAEWLDTISPANPPRGILVFGSTGYGWIIHSGSPDAWEEYGYDAALYSEATGVPKDLATVMLQAIRVAADYVLFDRDGEILPDLPYFDW